MCVCVGGGGWVFAPHPHALPSRGTPTHAHTFTTLSPHMQSRAVYHPAPTHLCNKRVEWLVTWLGWVP